MKSVDITIQFQLHDKKHGVESIKDTENSLT